MRFDSGCNNWQASNLRNFLNDEFYDELVAAVGTENIIPFDRNLLSMDGQIEYGVCEDKVSLLTMDEYRKYRALIPNTGDYWWWLITPNSTKCNNDERWVAVVSPRGIVDCLSCDAYNYYNHISVRPFCIFSSKIFAKKLGAEEYDEEVCEWKWGIDYAQVQCQGDKIPFGSRRLFSYCPYCGKKIKEVE